MEQNIRNASRSLARKRKELACASEQLVWYLN